MSDNDDSLPPSPVTADPFRIQMTADMITSDVPLSRRVAPDLDAMHIIGDLHRFAEKLRAGSTPGGPFGPNGHRKDG